MGKTNPLNLINKYRLAIMGLAALWILLHHVWIPITPEGTGVYTIEKLLKFSGYTGVDIFLLLSGMGLYYAIQKHSIKTFYKRRFIRILPPFILFAAIVAIIDRWTILEFIGNITGYNMYFKYLHSFLWFVHSIITLYMLFPLYYKLFNKSKSKNKFTAFALLIWLVVSLLLINIMRLDLFQFTNRIPIFLIGVLLGWKSEHEDMYFNKLHWTNCIIALFVGLYIIYFDFNLLYLSFGIFIVIGSHFTIPAILIAISYVALAAKICSELVAKKCGGIVKVLTLIGSISFELYIVQQWVWDKLTVFWEDYNINNFLINIINITIIFISAIILKILVKYLRLVVDRIKIKH